ncbi:hypothetical protein ACTFIU_010187 [Dictyostelium citrinum]
MITIRKSLSKSSIYSNFNILNAYYIKKGFCSSALNTEKSEKEKLIQQINQLGKQGSFNKPKHLILQEQQQQQQQQKEQEQQEQQERQEQQQFLQQLIEQQQKLQEQFGQDQRSLFEKSKEVESIDYFGDLDFHELETKPLLSIPNVLKNYLENETKLSDHQKSDIMASFYSDESIPSIPHIILKEHTINVLIEAYLEIGKPDFAFYYFKSKNNTSSKGLQLITEFYINIGDVDSAFKFFEANFKDFEHKIYNTDFYKIFNRLITYCIDNEENIFDIKNRFFNIISNDTSNSNNSNSNNSNSNDSNNSKGSIGSDNACIDNFHVGSLVSMIESITPKPQPLKSNSDNIENNQLIIEDSQTLKLEFNDDSISNYKKLVTLDDLYSSYDSNHKRYTVDQRIFILNSFLKYSIITANIELFLDITKRILSKENCERVEIPTIQILFEVYSHTLPSDKPELVSQLKNFLSSYLLNMDDKSVSKLIAYNFSFKGDVKNPIYDELCGLGIKSIEINIEKTINNNEKKEDDKNQFINLLESIFPQDRIQCFVESTLKLLLNDHSYQEAIRLYLYFLRHGSVAGFETFLNYHQLSYKNINGGINKTFTAFSENDHRNLKFFWERIKNNYIKKSNSQQSQQSQQLQQSKSKKIEDEFVFIGKSEIAYFYQFFEQFQYIKDFSYIKSFFNSYEDYFNSNGLLNDYIFTIFNILYKPNDDNNDVISSSGIGFKENSIKSTKKRSFFEINQSKFELSSSSSSSPSSSKQITELVKLQNTSFYRNQPYSFNQEVSSTLNSSKAKEFEELNKILNSKAHTETMSFQQLCLCLERIGIINFNFNIYNNLNQYQKSLILTPQLCRVLFSKITILESFDIFKNDFSKISPSNLKSLGIWDGVFHGLLEDISKISLASFLVQNGLVSSLSFEEQYIYCQQIINEEIERYYFFLDPSISYYKTFGGDIEDASKYQMTSRSNIKRFPKFFSDYLNEFFKTPSNQSGHTIQYSNYKIFSLVHERQYHQAYQEIQNISPDKFNSQTIALAVFVYGRIFKEKKSEFLENISLLIEKIIFDPSTVMGFEDTKSCFYKYILKWSIINYGNIELGHTLENVDTSSVLKSIDQSLVSDFDYNLFKDLFAFLGYIK